MSVIIAIANQKGGVGKTTTAVTLAHGLALRGKSALIVDLDSQGNVADYLGMDAGPELARMLNPVLPEPVAKCAISTGRENLDVIRSDKTTAALKTALSGLDFREFVLAEALDKAPGYEYILLDCAPSVDVLHTAALVAADWLIAPTQLSQGSVKGIRDLLVSLAEVHRKKRTVCQLAGVLPTFYDRVTGESQGQLENLVKNFRRFVLPPIPADTKTREASRAGKTLFEYAPGCRALVGVGDNGGYVQVIERLLEVLR